MAIVFFPRFIFDPIVILCVGNQFTELSAHFAPWRAWVLFIGSYTLLLFPVFCVGCFCFPTYISELAVSFTLVLAIDNAIQVLLVGFLRAVVLNL